ncbi:MAG: histidine phosphatase family protein [Wujia sp.]
MEIYIVRHGQTLWNKVKRFQGSADIELSEEGRELARESGRNLLGTHFDKVFSSPLCRAMETARLFCGGRDIEIIVDERLRELNFGSYEGQLYDDLVNNDALTFKYFFSQPELYVPDESGETIEHLIERAGEFMREVVEPLENTCERIMIVAHGALNKALMCYIKKLEKKDLWSGGLQKNCNVIIVNYSNHHYDIIEETRLFYETKK